MSNGKGDKRRRSDGSADAYRNAWDRTFAPEPMECPACGEIELWPMGVDDMWECFACHHEEQHV